MVIEWLFLPQLRARDLEWSRSTDISLKDKLRFCFLTSGTLEKKSSGTTVAWWCFGYIVIQVHCSRGFLEIPVTDLSHRERKTNSYMYMYLTNDNRGFAQQPCCMAWTIDFFPMGKSVLSYAKYFHCFCHATWLTCKTATVLTIFSW